MGDQDQNKQDDGNGTANADQDKAQQDKGTGAPPDKSEHMIPKSRFDQVVSQRKAAEAALGEFVESLVEQVPEDQRELIPDLPPAQKGKWLQAALAKGLFGGQSAASGPDAKRPGGSPSPDIDQMSPRQMRASGYKS